MDILKWAIFQKYGKMWVPVTNLLGDRARLRTLQSLSTQNTLVGWATLKLRVGFPCGNGIRVAVSSQSAVLTETPTCALYRLGRKNHVLHRKYHQVCALEAFPRENEALSTTCPGEGGTSNTRICKHLFLTLLERQSDPPRSHAKPVEVYIFRVPSQCLSTALPFVLADAL